MWAHSAAAAAACFVFVRVLPRRRLLLELYHHSQCKKQIIKDGTAAAHPICHIALCGNESLSLLVLVFEEFQLFYFVANHHIVLF